MRQPTPPCRPGRVGALAAGFAGTWLMAMSAPATAQVRPPAAAPAAPAAPAAAQAASAPARAQAIEAPLQETSPSPPATQRTFEASVETTLTATNNGNGAPRGQERKDLILNVQPRMRVDRRGAGLTVLGDAGVSLLTSTNDTRENKALPFGQLNASATLVERLINLSAAVTVRQVEQDAFATRVDPNSTENAVTESTLRLMPSLNYDFSPRNSLLLTDEETWTRYSGDADRDSQFRRTSFALRRRPQPFGAALEVAEEQLNYANSDTADWRSRSVLASASYAFSNDWLVGVLAGTERSRFAASTQVDQRTGVRLLWAPGPRTELVASVERRYFGTGFDLRARHRTIGTSTLIRLLREPAAGSNQPGTSAASGGRLVDFIDAILTSRYADPGQRAAEAADLMAARGLETDFPGAAGIVANYAQLRTGAQATLVALGTRHVLTLSAYGQALRQLARRDGEAIVLVPADADARQFGGSVGLNRRLSRVTTVDLQGRWSVNEGTGLRAGDEARESSYRLSFQRRLSPRTGATAGLQFRSVESRGIGIGDFRETSGFVGLSHRF